MMKTCSYIALCIFLYLASYALYNGLLHPIPALGDSWDYHIPISQSIINGTFIDMPNAQLPQWYYPGSSEAINSLFLLAHIPLTLSNILAIVVLVFVCFRLARTFHLPFYTSLLFAVTIGTLTVLTRWFNSVSIDVWVAIFFLSSITLLEKLQPTYRHFFLLGIFLGMLIGSKYMAIAYVVLLVIVYIKKLISNLSIKRFFVLLIPFTLLGLFWYIRNFFLLGNPVYPLCVLNLPCQELFTTNVISVTIQYPMMMLNALFSEYKLWLVAPFVVGFFLIRSMALPDKLPYGFIVLTIIGIINLTLYLFFPTSSQPWIMVSSLRYSYPAFIPLILAIFLLAKHLKKEQTLGYFAIANMLPTLTMAYYPKLLLLYFPLFLVTYYFLEKMNKQNA